MAFEVVKQMQADGLEWGEGYRPLGRRALAESIEGRMAEAVDYWLEGLDTSAVRDRRNGSYSRHLLTELGDIALSMPRTRRFCPTEVLRRYARRPPEIDRAILAGFVLGLSTRKVGEVLLALLGRPVSAATVSRVLMEWTPPSGGIAMCHVGGVVNAKRGKGRPLHQHLPSVGRVETGIVRESRKFDLMCAGR